MRVQHFLARLALALLALATLMALAALLGVRLGDIAYASGFSLMTAATCVGLAALAAALAWLFSAIRHNQGTGKRPGMIALLGSLALVTPPLHTAYQGLVSPAIFDATTDPEDPPQFVALAKARQPGMNSPVYDGSQQIHFRGITNTANYMLHTYYINPTVTDGIHPRVYLLRTQPERFWHAFETVKKLGWHIVDYSEKDGRIEATDKSFWFGQTADIAIRVRQAGSEGVQIDARAQNETGAHDFGSNIARLKRFLKAL